MWWVASISGAVMVVTGLLPRDDAWDLTTRVAPVLLFLVAITVVAELVDEAGVFDAAAHRAARLARGSVLWLFLLVVVIATLTTATLSLDTTAVLLTPVVLATALQLGLPPLPFAMVTVWLANTASLFLPVSNLTNLLALHELDLDSAAFVARTWLPALIAVGLTVVVIGLRYRHLLRGRFTPHTWPGAPDRVLFGLCVGVLCVLVPAFLLTDYTIAASVAAIVLVVGFAWRRRSALRVGLIPWRIVLLVLGLFITVGALADHGLTRVLGDLVGTGTSFPDLLRASATSAVVSNPANNLPTYIAMEPVADGSTPRLLAVLVGVNLGPLVLLWGSLATLLWHDRCRARGVTVSAREFATVGLIGVPLLVVSCTAALLVTT